MICLNCKFSITEDSQFCNNCGEKVKKEPSIKSEYIHQYTIDFSAGANIANQIRALFFKDLESVVETEIGPKQYRKYFDQFYESGFHKKFDLRTLQLEEQIQQFYSNSDQFSNEKLDKILRFEFSAFIEHFLLIYCNDLHGWNLPESILKYTNIKPDEVNLRQMILDYLDFENEEEQVYLDFLTIPPTKIKNAIQSFVFTQTDEKIFFICDQTVFGSCKEGFVMTDRGLYWKSHFNPAQSLLYKDLKEVKIDAEWIKINGKFFNVNKSINFKLLKLLKKIKQLL